MMNSFSNAVCGNLPVIVIKTVGFAEVAGNGTISPYTERAVLGVSPFFSLPVGGSRLKLLLRIRAVSVLFSLYR